MIDPKVSNDIELVLVNESFTTEFLELAKSDFDYLSEWLEWPRFCKTKQDFAKFVTDSISDYNSGKSMNCAILYKQEFSGVAGFNKIDMKLRRVEIGYWIGSKFQKKGIVTMVCRHLIEHAFKIPEINKAQISVAVDNYSSRAVCERLDMTLEGIISNKERVGDRVLDHAIYALHRGKT